MKTRLRQSSIENNGMTNFVKTTDSLGTACVHGPA
jgi:hypothetical protein